MRVTIYIVLIAFFSLVVSNCKEVRDEPKSETKTLLEGQLGCLGPYAWEKDPHICPIVITTSLPTIIIGDSEVELNQEETLAVLTTQAENYLEDEKAGKISETGYELLNAAAKKAGVSISKLAQSLTEGKVKLSVEKPEVK